MTTYFRKLGHHRWEYGYEYSGRLIRAGISRTRRFADQWTTSKSLPPAWVISENFPKNNPCISKPNRV